MANRMHVGDTMSGTSVENYKQLLRKYGELKAGQLIRVVLNTEAPVGSKRQICLWAPEYNADLPAFQSHSDYKSYADSRVENGDFKKLEQLALIGDIPKYNEDVAHHPLTNPDIRRKLVEISEDPWSVIDSVVSEGSDEQSSSNTDSPGGASTAIQWSTNQSDKSANAIIDKIHHLIAADALPSESNLPIEANYFGLRMYLYGRIAPYVSSWPDADITFTSFEQLAGDTADGYKIAGHLEAAGFQLKAPEDLDEEAPPNLGPNVPTADALEDTIRQVLIRFLRLASFNPAGVSQHDVGVGARIAIGQGGDPAFRLQGLETAVVSSRKGISHAEAVDYKLSKAWFDRLSIDVEAPGDDYPIEFELELTPRN